MAFWERKRQGTSELRGVLAEEPEPWKRLGEDVSSALSTAALVSNRAGSCPASPSKKHHCCPAPGRPSSCHLYPARGWLISANAPRGSLRWWVDTCGILQGALWCRWMPTASSQHLTLGTGSADADSLSHGCHRWPKSTAFSAASACLAPRGPPWADSLVRHPCVAGDFVLSPIFLGVTCCQCCCFPNTHLTVMRKYGFCA